MVLQPRGWIRQGGAEQGRTQSRVVMCRLQFLCSRTLAFVRVLRVFLNWNLKENGKTKSESKSTRCTGEPHEISPMFLNLIWKLSSSLADWMISCLQHAQLQLCNSPISCFSHLSVDLQSPASICLEPEIWRELCALKCRCITSTMLPLHHLKSDTEAQGIVCSWL